MPLSALGFQGVGSGVGGARCEAARGRGVWGGWRRARRETEGRCREAPLNIYSAPVEWGWRLWGGGGWLRLGGWGMFGGG